MNITLFSEVGMLGIYDSKKGGWVVDGELKVPADINLIGNSPEPWMRKVAALDMGVGGVTAQEVISEVIQHIYKREYKGKVFMSKPVYHIPQGLFDAAREEATGDNVKVLIDLFESMHHSLSDLCI